MSHDFIVNRGIESKIALQELKSGSIWITEDGQNLYLDSKDGTKRIQITDVIDITNNQSEQRYFPNKIYISGHTLNKYNTTTGQLEIISNLESEVLESNEEFVYDTTDNSKATLKDTSNPLKGTIVIDKNGDVGIIKSVNDNASCDIIIIANNKFKNLLTNYNIYVDTNYEGYQVGSFEYPFNNWNDLVEKSSELLHNMSNVTVYVKSNSELEINDFTSLRYVKFVGDKSSLIFRNVVEANSNLSNIVFENISIKTDAIGDSTDKLSFSNCSDLYFVHNDYIDDIVIDSCENIHFNAITEMNDLNIVQSKNVNIRNVKHINNVFCNETTNDLFIYTSDINSVQIVNSTDAENTYVELHDVQIRTNIDISGVTGVTLNGGMLLNYNTEIENTCNIQASIINLGTFNFNGINPILDGEISTISGLSSKQIYDNNNRTYNDIEAENETLEAHLDAISNAFMNTGAFKSKCTFSTLEELLSINPVVGNVIKYTGYLNLTYEKEYSLNLVKIVNMYTNPDTGKTMYSFYFTLPNASYFCKINNVISVKYKDNEPYNVTITSIAGDTLIAQIETDSVITSFDATNLDLPEQLLYECIFVQNLSLNTDDRLVYLGNGYDKISGSSDGSIGNYRIVKTYDQLSNIMTNSTRPIGMLAYVQDDDITYQWKYIDNDETILGWMEFSSGSDNGSRAKISLYGEPMLYRQDNSDITIQIQTSNCTTGILRASYQFAGLGETKRTVDIQVPYIGIYDVTLTNIADRSGLLNVAISFISTDENIRDSSSSVNLTFFVGNLLTVNANSFYLLQSYNSEKKYNIGVGISKNIDVCNLDELTSDLILNYDVSTKNSDKFIVYFTLYKDNEIITTFESEPTNKTANYRINLPTETKDGMIINYDAGYYKVEAYAKDNMFTSNTVNYEFILEDSNPTIVLLDNTEIHIDPEDYITLNYIIICNITSQINFEIEPRIFDKNNDIKNYASIVENPIISSSDILIAHNISFTQLDCDNDKSYLISLLLTSTIGDDISSYVSVYFENKNYMPIVQKDNYTLLFNLDSRNKMNNSSDRGIWDSSIVSNNNVGSLYNFSYFDDGWVSKVTDDSGTINVLTSDGYATYATLNVNPMYQYSDTSIFDCTKGFTFEIKYKYNELYKDGAIVECVNDENKGFILKGNEIIWSPFVNIDSANSENACISRLTTDTWHDINVVLATNAGDNFYKTYMYNGEMSGNSVAMLFIDGVLVSIVDGGSNTFYSTNTKYTRMMTLFAQYDYENNIAQNFIKGEIMHIRMYNNALTPDEILTNYIANIHDVDNQIELKVINDYNNEQKEFGATAICSLPKLTISNANLSSMDSIMGPEAKNYIYPNVGLKLEYNNSVLVERYGSVCKCQGTSSTNYAIKNYKITFYDITEPLEDKMVYDTVNATYYVGDSTHPNSYNTMVADDNNYTRYKYINNDKDNGYKISKDAVSINGWLGEDTYTLKADYMDSSHSHNTGTAKFVNNYLPEIPPQAEGSPYDDPSESTKISYSLDEIKAGDYNQSTIDAGQYVNPRTKIRHSIDGFPCLVVYEYIKNGKTEVVPKGIYQFDVDKNANNIFGYGKYQNCKSYEISNNSTSEDDFISVSAAAGFNVNILDKTANTYKNDPLYSIKEDIEIRYHPNEELNEVNIEENIQYIINNWGLSNDVVYFDKTNEDIVISYSDKNILDEIEAYYVNIKQSMQLYHAHWGYSPYINDEGYLALHYMKHALNPGDETLRLGLTYIDDYKFKTDDSDHHQHDELKHLFMWLQDCKNGTRDFIFDFNMHFDKTNIEYYIILVRLFGMIDNLAKNMMITSWNCDDEKVVYTYNDLGQITGIDYNQSTFCKWQLQFYDLDTCFGLTNTGQNILNTSIDIYGHDRTTDLVVEEGNDVEHCEDITERTYNASSSLLWKLILDSFGRLDYSGKSATGYYSLQGVYKQLRMNVLTPEKVKNNYFNNITNKIGQYYYNFDALNKYFGWNFSDASDRIKYFYMCQGNAKEHMADWIDKRFIYIDSLYASDNGQIADRPSLSAPVENKNIGVLVKAPMYLPVQFADVNTLDNAQLCTSKCYNLINCSFESDANVIFYQVNNVLAFRGLGIFNFDTLDLSNATSLIELNCSDLPNLANLTIGSEILQKLNLANSRLTNIDVSKLTNLIDLDISNSTIETIIFNSDTSSAYNIKTLNISGSKLKNLNFGTLTSLESFGKVNLSTDTSWNSYTKLLNQIKYYQLAGDSNDPEYAQKELEYIQKLVNTLKNVLKSEGKLSTFNNDINNDETYDETNYYDILRYMMTNAIYRNLLAQQYIPNLAILSGIKSSYDNITFNSDKLRAIVFTSNVINNTFGTEGGSISISSKNLKHLEINRSNIGDGVLSINNPNMTYLKLNNCNYTGVINLNEASKLETINLSDNKNFTDIIYSSELVNNDTLRTLNLSKCYQLKSFTSINNDTLNNYVFDMTGFDNLTTFNILDVIRFKELKGLSLKLSSANIANMKLNVTCSSDKVSSRVEEVKELGYTAAVSGNIILTNTLSLASMFSGRQNWIFDKSKFTITNLGNCTSLSNTFNLCQQLTYDYVNYVLSNIDSTCTNIDNTFRGCIGITFTDNIVPATLFNKCTGVTSAIATFGNIGRDSLNGHSSKELYGKLTLSQGIFDSLTKCTTIRCMFNDCSSNLNSGSDVTVDTTVRTYEIGNSELINKSIHAYYSYVGKFNVDIFDKMTSLNNIGLEDSYVGTIFTGANNTNIICDRDNNRDFNTIFAKLNNYKLFTNLFTRTGTIKYDNGNVVMIDKRIFAKYNNNNEFISISVGNSNSSSTAIKRMFANMNTNMSINFENLFMYLEGYVTCENLFENYSKAFVFNPLLIDSSKLHVTSTAFMYSNCKNMTGYLFMTKTDSYVMADNKNYTVVEKNGTDNCFTKQSTIISTAGMFYNCTNFGGLTRTTWKDSDNDGLDDTIVGQIDDNDLPINLFEDLKNVTNIAYMFYNCTNMNIWFDDLYDLENNITIYPFKNCTVLKDISYLFYNCIGLKHELPSYGAPGSKLDDYKYVYYEITDSVNTWLNTLTPAQLSYNSSGAKVSYPENYTFDEATELTHRIYNYRLISSWGTFVDKYKLTYAYSYDITDSDSNVTGTNYEFYQYYKECNYHDENVRYLGDNTSNHTHYILIPGLFCNYNENDTSSITKAKGVFQNCSNLTGQIPSNIFRNMNKVTTVASFFNGCINIGTTDVFESSAVRPESSISGLEIEPPYIYPYSLFDDMIQLTTINSCFKYVGLLSRPFKTLSYNRSEDLNTKTIGGTNLVDEIYALPKYLLYYNVNLTDVSYAWCGDSDICVTGCNELYGQLYPSMFIKNTGITTMSYTFFKTQITGSKSIIEGTSTKKYIGSGLFSTLKSLNDVSYMFGNTNNLRYLVNPNTRDLIFDTSVHGRNMITKGFINSTGTSGYGCWEQVFGNDVKGKIVKNNNGTTFDKDYQCYQYFINTDASDTLTRYEG